MSCQPLHDLDSRIVVDEHERIVVRLESGIGVTVWPGMAIVVTIAIALALLGASFFHPRVSLAGALAVGVVLALAALPAFRSVTLVAVAAEDALFIETANPATRRKKRRQLARLSRVTAFDVRQRVDMDSALAGPSRYYELSVVVSGGHRVPVWYGGSRAAADALGAALLRLRENATVLASHSTPDRSR